ncbi:hypothetical protein K445DRAFT_314423 [Daldinia sp. EC12]|nr:hypothetical protein F4774DRAFT_421852 [Daldinia eschscholtzii]OTB19537.1 hypothetical protein K445DRAFT_314423 [Daldinia sp. EC12]
MDPRSHDAPASSSSIPSGLFLRSSRTASPLHDSHRPIFEMTEPPSERPPIADTYDHPDHEPHPFAPIFTLVNNASTRTTHHPHVRYIFSDDDPDILTRALVELDIGVDGAASDPALSNRAMILDLAPDPIGGYSVAWASSLSPSWAVLDAQLSQIAPHSSDGESNNDNEGGDGSGRPDRLMLKIEGVEGNSLGSEGGLSGETSRHGSGSGSGGGSGQHDRDRGEIEDYTNLMDKFDKQMNTLRKIVDASEERQRKTAADTYTTTEPPQAVAGRAQYMD